MRPLTATAAVALWASSALAQAPAPPETPAPPSSGAPGAEQPAPAAPEPPAAGATPSAAPAKSEFNLIGDIAYEPGVGLRYKTPKTFVVLYGLLEPTISTVSNAAKNGAWQTGFQVSWFSGNRWGIGGSQSLVKSDALKAIFRLESEFELPTGNMDTHDVLFNRDAWMGFESVLGKITFGRQNTLARDFSQNYGDPYGTAAVTYEEGGWTNVNNFKQLIFFAGSVTGTRMDNGVVWKKRFGEHVMAGAGFQFNAEGGNAAPGHFSRNTTGSGGLGLDFGPLNVSGFVTEANHSGFNQHGYSAGGNYRFSVVRVNAGYFRYEADQGALGHRHDDAFTVSTSITLAPISENLELSGGFQRIKANNAAYNGGGHIINPFASTASATAAGGTGAKNTGYGSLAYKWNRSTMTYVAFDYMTLSDGYAVAGATAGEFSGKGPHKDQIELAVGTRISF